MVGRTDYKGRIATDFKKIGTIKVYIFYANFSLSLAAHFWKLSTLLAYN